MVIICDMKYEGHIIHGLYLFCECQGAEMHLRQIFRIPLQPGHVQRTVVPNARDLGGNG